MIAPPPAWCAAYVGIPFEDKGRGPDAYDCWGLARVILEKQFGLPQLPDYAEAYSRARDHKSVARAVSDGLAQGWMKVPGPAEAGDLIVIKIAGRPWHCAVAVGDDWMLHVVDGAGTCLEQFTREPWKNRVEGLYRYDAASRH